MSQISASAGVRMLRWVTLTVVLAAALFALLLNWPWGSGEADSGAESAPATARPGQILYLVPDGASEGTHLAPQYQQKVEGLESVERSEWRFRELLLWPTSSADDDLVQSIARVIPLRSSRWGAAPEYSREIQLERDLLLGLRSEIESIEEPYRSYLYPGDLLVWLQGGRLANNRSMAWDLSEMRPDPNATLASSRITLEDWQQWSGACSATMTIVFDDRLHSFGDVYVSNLGYWRPPPAINCWNE